MHCDVLLHKAVHWFEPDKPHCEPLMLLKQQFWLFVQSDLSSHRSVMPVPVLQPSLGHEYAIAALGVMQHTVPEAQVSVGPHWMPAPSVTTSIAVAASTAPSSLASEVVASPPAAASSSVWSLSRPETRPQPGSASHPAMPQLKNARLHTL